MAIKQLGPLDWRIPIVTQDGRPTQEFQRRWINQQDNNAQIGGIALGSGPPTSLNPSDGSQYADTSTTPYTLYIAYGGSWGLVGTPQPVGANPTAIGSDVAVNGTAPTFMRSDASPAIQKASSSQFGLVKVDGTTITESGGVISASGGGGGGGYTLISAVNITSPTAYLDFNVSGYSEVVLLGISITTSSSGYRSVFASVDGGSSFYDTSGDYYTIASSGAATATTSWGSHGTSSSGTYTTTINMYGLNIDGTNKLAVSNGFTRLFTASTLPVNALRIMSTSGNMTGGRVHVIGR